MRRSLVAAFRACPQALLQTCLESLDRGSGELYETSLELLSDFLKLHEAGTGPRPKNGLVELKGDPLQPSSLAHDVLAGSPEACQWLRSAIERLKRGTIISPPFHFGIANQIPLLVFAWWWIFALLTRRGPLQGRACLLKSKRCCSGCWTSPCQRRRRQGIMAADRPPKRARRLVRTDLWRLIPGPAGF